MRSVSEAFRAAAFAQSTETVFIVLLTINHSTLATPIRLASDPYELLPSAGVRGVVSRGDEYIYLPFSISLPAEDETGIGKAKLSIDNIDRSMVLAVRNAIGGGPIEVTIEVITSADVDVPEISFQGFRFERISYDAFAVSGDLSIEYFGLEPFPARRFTPADFPGLF